jgi:hypothetical protein
MDLDELSDFALHEELRRRRLLRNKMLCSYCGKCLADKVEDTKTCKLHERFIGMLENNVLVERM